MRNLRQSPRLPPPPLPPPPRTVSLSTVAACLLILLLIAFGISQSALVQGNADHADVIHATWTDFIAAGPSDLGNASLTEAAMVARDAQRLSGDCAIYASMVYGTIFLMHASKTDPALVPAAMTLVPYHNALRWHCGRAS